MQNNIKIYLISIVILSIISCKSDCDCDFNSPVTITAKIQDPNMLIGTQKTDFEVGDTIGVYMVNYIGGQPQNIETASTYKNVPYVYDGTYWNSPGSGLTLSSPLTVAGIYSYYPYDKDMGVSSNKTDIRNYPFSVQTNQKNSVIVNDFLWAKYDNVSVGDDIAKLTFRHVLSKIIVNLVYDDEYYDLNSFLIVNLKNNCTINMNDAKVTVTGSANNISPYDEPVPNLGFQHSVSAIIIPQTIQTGTSLFSILHDNALLTYEVQETINFEQGEAYVFNIVLGTASLRNDADGSIIYRKISLDKSFSY